MACFLVIDEDATARRTLRELLSEHAHDVVETAVGADGVDGELRWGRYAGDRLFQMLPRPQHGWERML